MALRAYLFPDDALERERLLRQGAFYADLTRGFLVAAGIADKRRVLDIGCGVGSVSLLLNDLLPADAHLVGMDVSTAALQTAQGRLTAAGQRLRQAEFVRADLSRLTGYCPPELTGPFDAIVGRFVLMYLDDPVAVLRALQSLLSDDGVLILQEPDHTNYCRTQPASALYDQVGDYIDAFGKACGLPENFGLQLPGVLEAAGFNVLLHQQVSRFDSGPSNPVYDMLARTMCGMRRQHQHLLEKEGWDATFLPTVPPLAPGDGDQSHSDQLTVAMEDEAVQNRLRVMSSTLIGVVAKKQRS